MSPVADISVWELAISFLLLIIPLLFFLYFRIHILKSVLISVVRMVLQLMLIAFYLEWIFDANNPWINSLWVIIMIFVGVFTSIKRVGLKRKYFVFPLVIASLTSVVIIDAFFFGYVLKLDNLFESRYFIPITGMVLGNAMSHNIIGLSAYFKELNEKEGLYQFLLTNTGSAKLSLRPFIREAIKQGLNPLIASMSVIGLISLPGMMTGQILGGSSPAVAIKYQIMIMLAIFVGCTINLFISIIFSNRFVFDEYGNFRKRVIKSTKR